MKIMYKIMSFICKNDIIMYQARKHWPIHYISKYFIVWVCALAPRLVKGNPWVYNTRLLSSIVFNQSTLLIDNIFFNCFKL